MTSEEHVREELGAYVLGALEPGERRAVEAHVTICPPCRDELARLSGMPALLDRLTPEEAMADLTPVPAVLAPRVVLGVAGEARRLRREVRAWRAVAAAGVAASFILALLWWAPWQPPPDRLVTILHPVAVDAAAADGTVATYAWEWGTTVEVRVEGLPRRARYVMWAIGEDGERHEAGTWGPTPDGGVYVRGASAIQRDRLSSIEVRDLGGELLLGAQMSPP